MKKTKIIGVALIVSSLLIQVAYATSTGLIISNRDRFDVHFNEVSYTASPYLDIKLKELSGAEIQVEVKNLYPGAYYTVECAVKNDGELDAKLSGVKVSARDENKDLLYEAMSGYIIDKDTYVPISEYDKIIQNQYKDQVIEPGEILTVSYTMGLNPEVTDIQEQEMKYELAFQLEQITDSSEGGSGGGDSSGGESDGGSVPGENGETDENNTEIEIPEEDIPAGAIPESEEQIIDIEEEIPGGGISANTDKENDKSQKNEESYLPQTGGIPGGAIYLLGIVMLGTGITLYRKKQDEE